MKRILLISSSMDNGGAEKWVLDTVAAMNRTGISIDLYYWCGIKTDTFLPEYEQLGLNVYIDTLSGSAVMVALQLFRRLRRFILENGPYDAIHINGTKLIYQAVSMLVADRSGIPVRIVHSHNTAMSKVHLLGNFFRNKLRRCIFMHSTCIAACSVLAGTTKYGDNVTSNPKFVVLRNGINTERFVFSENVRADVRQELGLIADDTVILHIGRMMPQKNQMFVLDVFAAAFVKNKKTKLLLVGEGPDRSKICEKIKLLGLDRQIILIPWSEHPEKYYNAADIFLLPSLFEGLPIVLLEAQANGLPCFVSDTVTDESNVTDTVKFLSLGLSSDKWAEALFASRGRYENTVEVMKDKGYDIAQTAQEFREILLGQQTGGK